MSHIGVIVEDLDKAVCRVDASATAWSSSSEEVVEVEGVRNAYVSPGPSP